MATMKDTRKPGKATSAENIALRCCICGSPVEQNDPDGYALQLRKFGAQSPEMVWAHGSCLRNVIPVIGVEIPNS
jgi:hypothetical protein